MSSNCSSQPSPCGCDPAAQMQRLAAEAGKVEIQQLPLPVAGLAFDGQAAVGQQVIAQRARAALAGHLLRQQMPQGPAHVQRRGRRHPDTGAGRRLAASRAVQGRGRWPGWRLSRRPNSLSPALKIAGSTRRVRCRRQAGHGADARQHQKRQHLIQFAGGVVDGDGQHAADVSASALIGGRH